jgi:hypothetical protein
MACGGDPPPPPTAAYIGVLTRELFTSTEQSAVIAGAEVFVTTTAGTQLDLPSLTDPLGNFTATNLPKNINATLVFSQTSGTPAYVRSAFPGQTAGYYTYIFYGAVYEAEVADAQTLVAQYATAAGVSTASLMTFPAAEDSTAGAMVVGKVVTLIQSPQGIQYQNVSGATVTVDDEKGKSYRVFYRGDFPAGGTEPGPIDPTATSTGNDSVFVAFGINALGTTSANLPFPSSTVTVTVVTTNGKSTFSQGTLVVQDGITQLDNFAVVVP